MNPTSSARLVVHVVDSSREPIADASVEVHRGRKSDADVGIGPSAEPGAGTGPETAGSPDEGPAASPARRARRSSARQPIDESVARHALEVEPETVTLVVRAEGYRPERITVSAMGGDQELVVGLRRRGELSYDYGDSRIAFRPDRRRFLLVARGDGAAEIVDREIKRAELEAEPVVRAGRDESQARDEPPDEASRVIAGPMDPGDRVRRLAQEAGLEVQIARLIPNPEGPPFGLTNEIVVRFASAVERPEAERIGGQFGLEITRSILHAGNAYLFVRPGLPEYDLLGVVQALRDDPRVVYAEPNLLYFLQSDQYTPNDPLFGNLAHLQLINGDDAWDRLDNVAVNLRGGSPNITISVVDLDGVAPDHPDLTANLTDGTAKMVRNVNFAANPIVNQTAAALGGGHGTQCAGSATAAFDDNRGITGVAPNCHLVAARTPGSANAVGMADLYLWIGGFLNGSTAAGFPTTVPARPADVISSSWGANGLVLSNTIRDCFDFLTTYGRGGRGILLCWSLGNNGYLDFTNAAGIRHRAWPTYQKTIGVGASINTNPTNPTGSVHADPTGATVNIATAVDQRALYSPFGATALRKPDLVSPAHTAYNPGLIDPIMSAVNVGTGTTDGCPGPTVCNDYQANFGGTSHATPTVAGAIALILSARSDLSWVQVRDVLRQTCARIDAAQANAIGQWQDLDGDGAIDYSRWYGAGRLDVDAAVAVVLTPTLALADVYVRENLSDIGDVPSPGWHASSPDIWVRASNDPIPALAWTSAPPHENAVRSHDCYVFCRARNRGTVPASTFYLRAMLTHYPGFEFRYPQEFQPTTPVGAPLPAPLTPGTYLIGESRIDNLAAGADQIVKFTWPQALIPPSTVTMGTTTVQWHPCLLLEVSPHDGPSPASGVIAIRSDNNIAQRNIAIDDSDSDSDAFVGMIAGTLDKAGVEALVVDTTHLRGRPTIRILVADPRVMERFIATIRNLDEELRESGGGGRATDPGRHGGRGCGVTVLTEGRLRFDCCGHAIEVAAPAGTVLRWSESDGSDGGVVAGVAKVGAVEVVEIRGLRGRLELPFELAGGQLVPMAAAVIGSAAGELRLTQRRGDAEVSPGYVIRRD